jgi:hypothetical protein
VPFTQPLPTGHSWPQPPQFSRSFWVSVHPLGQQAPRAVALNGQTVPRSPAEQVGMGVQKLFSQKLPEAQAAWHWPQLPLSLWVLVHTPPQQVAKGEPKGPASTAQVSPSCPAQSLVTQTTPPKPALQHWVPAGQLAAEQSVKPASGRLQAKPVQVQPAGQAWPQAPQLWGSVWVLVQPEGQQEPPAEPVEQVVPTLVPEQVTVAWQKP